MKLELTKEEAEALLLALDVAVEQCGYSSDDFIRSTQRHRMMDIEERLRKQQIEEK